MRWTGGIVRHDLRGKLGRRMRWLPVVAALALLGCGGEPEPEQSQILVRHAERPPPPEHSRYVTARQLMGELRGEEGAALQLLDVRSQDEYADHHIPGALHLPARLLGRDPRTQNRGIVLVDHGVPDGAARRWARAQKDSGHAVRVLHGGMQAWCRSRGQTKGSCLRAGHLRPAVLMPGGRPLEGLVWLRVGATPHSKEGLAQLLGPSRLHYATRGRLGERLREIRDKQPYAHVVLFDADGKGSFLLQEVQQGLDLNLFYLDGGEKALMAHATLIGASRPPSTLDNKLVVVTPGTSKGASKPRDTFPSGCGCL